MNPTELYSTLSRELENIKEAKTFKYEVPLESEQGGEVMVEGRETRVWMVRSKDDPEQITTAPIPPEVIAKFG